MGDVHSVRLREDVSAMSINSSPPGQDAPGVDLSWIPLGAGSPVVETSGRIFERMSARLQRRPPTGGRAPGWRAGCAVAGADASTAPSASSGHESMEPR